MCSTTTVRISHLKKLIKENKSTVRRVWNLRSPMRTSQPKRRRGGDGDRDACRRPCCFSLVPSFSLQSVLWSSRDYSCSRVPLCLLLLFSSPQHFQRVSRRLDLSLSPSSSPHVSLSPSVSLSPLSASVFSIIFPMHMKFCGYTSIKICRL